MAASSDMFVTVMRQSQLSQNEIENYIFDIAQKNSTDDHEVIADIYLQQHGGDVDAPTAADDIKSSRAEIKNFLRGCTNLEDQRAVRSRKSTGNGATAVGSIVAAATTANTAAATTTMTATTIDSDANAVTNVDAILTNGVGIATVAARSASVAISMVVADDTTAAAAAAVNTALMTVSDKGKERTRQHEEGGQGRSTKKCKKTQGGLVNGGRHGGRHAYDDDDDDVGSSGNNSRALNRMTMTSMDEDKVVVDNADSCAVVAEPVAESVADADEEIIDKGTVYDNLQEMRVTLEQDSNSENVNKNPPNTAWQVLSGLRVNKTDDDPLHHRRD